MQGRKLKIESCYCEPFILAGYPLPGQVIFLIHSKMILRVSTVADLTNKFGFPEQAIGSALKKEENNGQMAYFTNTCNRANLSSFETFVFRIN